MVIIASFLNSYLPSNQPTTLLWRLTHRYPEPFCIPMKNWYNITIFPDRWVRRRLENQSREVRVFEPERGHAWWVQSRGCWRVGEQYGAWVRGEVREWRPLEGWGRCVAGWVGRWRGLPPRRLQVGVSATRCSSRSDLWGSYVRTYNYYRIATLRPHSHSGQNK